MPAPPPAAAAIAADAVAAIGTAPGTACRTDTPDATPDIDTPGATAPVGTPTAVRRAAAAGAVLRTAGPDDALCLAVLAMQVYLDTYATHGIRAAIASEVLATFAPAVFGHDLVSPAARLTLAESEGHVVGFAHVVLAAAHDLAPAGVPAELLRLYVQEPFTGAGLGSRLLAAAEAQAAAGGTTVLWLTPWSHNHRALAFYARRGYADHGATWHTFDGESHPNRLLARRLDAVAASRWPRSGRAAPGAAGGPSTACSPFNGIERG